jgi:hypothetical protein
MARRRRNVFAYNKCQRVQQLLTTVFAAAFANGKHRGELKGFKWGLIAAGNMLVRIGLADRDQKSAFGVRPNEDLQGRKQPKRRLTSRKESAGIDDKNDLDAIRYPRIGGVRLDHDAGGFVLDVLGVLGLSDMLQMVMKS